VKEKTSSSFSGRHVGHYKAAVDNPVLVQVHSTMMSIPYQAGFSPKRWHQVVDVMLEKDPGNPKQHRLRIVALLESDYNQSQRILLARRVSHHMEDKGIMPKMQHGSRPSKMCISPVLNKVLSFDLVRQTKVTGAFIENDAIGCYDRMVNSVIFLELRRLGLPISVIQCIQNTWENACHHIRTKFGYSASTYSNSSTRPLFGPGQGSTTGPILWSILFCLIAKNLDREAMAMFFRSVTGSVTLKHYGDAFVDDSQLGSTTELLTGYSQPSPERDAREVVRALRTTAQRWERLLFTTDGALNLQKSSWTLMSWGWTNGVAKLKTTAQAPAELLLTAGYNTEPIPVPRLNPQQGFCTLGVHLTPSGSNSLAITKLAEKTTEYATAVSGSKLTRSAALWSYWLYYVPKVTYSTPALTLTEEECDSIQSPGVAAVLPKLHVNRNTSRAIVFGPISHGGLGLPTVYSTQSFGHLAYFTGHINVGDKTGKLLLISLSYLQLLSGSIQPILRQKYSLYEKWIEPSWLTALWAFLSKVGYRVTVSQEWLPEVPRKNDRPLMDQFISLGYSPAQLGALNRCRLYMQAIFLSDLVAADGMTIIPECKAGIRLVDRISHLTWPIQARPPNSAWTSWRNALSHFENKQRLLIPLRQWISETHQRWCWFSTPTSLLIYHERANGEWVSILPQTSAPNRGTRNSSKRIYELSKQDPATTAPAGLVPITLQPTPKRSLFTTSVGPKLVTAAPRIVIPCFEHSLYSTPLAELLAILREKFDQVEAVHIGVGSKRKGTDFIHGWSIYTTEYCCSEAGQLSGRLHLSEEAAILAGVLAVLYLLAALPTLPEKIWVQIPTKKLLQELTDASPRGISHMITSHYDLRESVRRHLASIRQKTSLSLVLTPLDDTSPTEAQLTLVQDRAHQSITNALESPTLIKIITGHPADSKATVERRGQLLMGDYRELIRSDLYMTRLREKISERERWSAKTYDSVAWPAFSKAMEKVPRVRTITYAKLANGLLQTNSHNNRFYGSTSTCPHCNKCEETLMHVFTCMAPEVLEEREELLRIHARTLSDCGTPSEIVEWFHQGLQQWGRLSNGLVGRQIPPTADISKQVLTVAYVDQTRVMGWEPFLRGRISNKWAGAYRAFYLDASDHEVTAWMSDVIRANLDLALELWRHRNGLIYGRD